MKTHAVVNMIVADDLLRQAARATTTRGLIQYKDVILPV